MKTRMNTTALQTLALGAFAAALAGCNLTGAMSPPEAFPTGRTPADAYTPASSAGLPVTPDPDGTKLSKLVAMRSRQGAFGKARTDPFALTDEERRFETVQTSERFFNGGGGFSVQITEKPDVEDEVTPPEPQPYRRLSGIVVGDSILAILEEQGKPPVIVTPGMLIPGSEWRVVSIDQDKAVLRRPGKTKPNQVIVRLESPPYGLAGVGGAGNGVPGGPPGGPPPGYGPGGGPAGGDDRGGF